MKLRDLLDQDHLLLVACHDCHAKTPLDPAYYALRLGVNASLADIQHEAQCPSCGSAETTLSAFSPVQERQRA